MSMRRILLTGSQSEQLPQLQRLGTGEHRELLLASDAPSAMRLLQLMPFDVLVLSGSFGETTDRWLMSEALRQNPEVKAMRRFGPLSDFQFELNTALFPEP
jgi:hypothetical protein